MSSKQKKHHLPKGTDFHHIRSLRRSAQAGEIRRKGHPQGAGRNPDSAAWAVRGKEVVRWGSFW